MSRIGSLRILMLISDNVHHIQPLKSYLSSLSIRCVSSYNPKTSSNALVTISQEDDETDETMRQWTRPGNFSTALASLATVAHTRMAPAFGMAKDRCPVRRTRRSEKQSEDAVIRHDAVYLQNKYQNGSPNPKRKYKQTWNEFSQNRVRPVTEWGYNNKAPK